MKPAVASFSAGPMSQDDPTPVGPDTIVRVASMTKQIVSVAAMALVERAKIMLDHPVERYLPCFQDMQVRVRCRGRDQARSNQDDVATHPDPLERADL